MTRANDQAGLVIIVPYRDRRDHLRRFVPALERHLAARAIKARMVIVHQVDNGPFNKGALLNIGFALCGQNAEWICVHDVDMLPDAGNDRDDYARPQCPTHLVGRAEQFNWRMPYPTYFGGVVVMPTESFRQVNGFSNQFWGWGCEDDDFFLRLVASGMPMVRKRGRYQSLHHSREVARSGRFLIPNKTRLRSTLLYAESRTPPDRTHLLLSVRGICDEVAHIPNEPTPSDEDGISNVEYNLSARIPLTESREFDGTTSEPHELLEVTLPDRHAETLHPSTQHAQADANAANAANAAHNANAPNPVNNANLASSTRTAASAQTAASARTAALQTPGNAPSPRW